MAIEENKPIVQETSSNFEELKVEIIKLSNMLDVEGHLTTFRNSLKIIDENQIPDAHYYFIRVRCCCATCFY